MNGYRLREPGKVEPRRQQLLVARADCRFQQQRRESIELKGEAKRAERKRGEAICARRVCDRRRHESAGAGRGYDDARKRAVRCVDGDPVDAAAGSARRRLSERAD